MPPKGTKMSEETKRKISESNMGKKHSKETKKILSEKSKGNKNCVGRVMSDETRDKISKANKGKRKGVKFLQEHKDKISKANKGHIVSDETRDKISKANKGKLAGSKNPKWKGGITRRIQIIRSSTHYQKWRQLVLERDCFTCVNCGFASDDLHVHHIISMSDNIDLSLDINNGVSLCYECHCNEHPGRYILKRGVNY